MGNRTRHELGLSELGFVVRETDLPIVTEYEGNWAFTGATPLPDNFWVVTMDGEGHSLPGMGSPQQLLDKALERGWQCAYVAPYGRFVEGEQDGIQLHDWIREGRHKHKRSLH